METGIGLTAKDASGRTALMHATEHGFVSIVDILLSAPLATKDIRGCMGPEALLCAAEKGNEHIVRLLAAQHVDLNNLDSAKRTPMILAAANASLGIVDYLLKQHADPNIKDNQKRSALHYAAWGGHNRVVKCLLDGGSEVDAPDDSGQTALHLAAESASMSVARQLLVREAKVNAESKDGQTALHRAAWGGGDEVVRLLLKEGALRSIRDRSKNKPWHVAALKGYEGVVAILLEGENRIQDEDDQISQMRGVLFAARRGYMILAKILLEKGAELAAKDGEGLTSLHWAAKRGDHTMAELLVTRQESIKILNSYDTQQRTPLCLAVLGGWARVVSLLLEIGADPNIRLEERRTVLHMAAAIGNGEIVQILIMNQVDPHACDDQGRKAWLLAAEAGHHRIVQLLFELEVNFNPRSPKIKELLVQMADKGFVSMVELLLGKGVDKDAVDSLGQTAMGAAAKSGKSNVVDCLIKGGADPGIADSHRQTPLLWAAQTGNLKVMELLLDAMTKSPASDELSPAPAAPSRGSQFDSVPKLREIKSSVADLLNYTDLERRTALLVAVQNEHDAAVKQLLEKGQGCGINVNLQDARGTTALHLATERGTVDLVSHLLEERADQALKDCLGRTALHLAAEKNQEAAAEILLRSPHATSEVRDLDGRIPLQVAVERGNTAVGKVLLRSYAEGRSKDKQICTELLLAVENGDKKTLDRLLNHDRRAGAQ